MADTLDDLTAKIQHEIANLKAERQALITQVHSLQMTKSELEDELKLEDWPAKVAEYRRMKADAKAFADKLESMGR